MADDLATLAIKVAYDDINAAADALDRLSSSSSKTEGAVGGLGRASQSSIASMNSLKNAAMGLFGAFSVKTLFGMTDAWSDMSSRINLASGSVERGSAVMSRLQEIARGTYSSLSQTAEGYLANAASMRELGFSTQQVLDYTSALNNAMVVSGAKAERATIVQNALAKAMALGKLSGENLNTVIQQGGEVATLLAEHFGTTTGGLLKLGQQGKITGDIVADVLIKNMEALEEKAGEMPATMGDAAMAWGNAFTIIVGTVDQAMGASGALGQTLYDLGYQVAGQADNIATAFVSMQMIGGAAIDAILSAFTGMFGAFDTGSIMLIAGVGLGTTALLGLAAAITGPVISAFSALTVAIMSNPIGMLVGAFAAAVTAAYLFRDEFKDILGIDLIDAAKGATNKIIGAFVAGYRLIVKYWERLPDVFSAIGAKAWNELLSQFEGEALGVEIMGTKYTLIGGLDLSGFKKEIKDTTQLLSDDIDKIWKDATSQDYVGSIADGIVKVWKDAGDAVSKFADIQNSLANDNKPKPLSLDAEEHAIRALKAYNDLLRSADGRIAQLEIEAKLLGKTGIEADFLRSKLEMLAEADRLGLSLTEKQIIALEGKADAIAKLTRQISEYQLMEDAVFEREQMFRSPIDQRIMQDLKMAGIEIDSVFAQTYASFVKTTDQIGLAKDATRDFAGSLVSDLIQGKSALDSLISALGKLGDKLIQLALDEAINGLFGNLFGAVGGSGFGLGYFPPAPSMGMGIPGFASGTANTGGMPGQPIGIVHGQEAVIPLPSGGDIPVRVTSNNSSASGAQNVHVTVGWSRTADGNLKPFIENVAQEQAATTFKAGIEKYDKGGAVRASRDLKQVSLRGYAR